MKTLAIAIPTYNEKENLENFVEEIRKVLINVAIDATLIIIDDTSPDGTGEIADKLAIKFNKKPFKLVVIHRQGKQGLASAYIHAFYSALSKNYDYYLSMDADFSHNPKYIPTMLKEMEENDLVIGSRNIKGGGVTGWGILRKIISRGGSLYSKLVLGSDIKDFTGGFNMYSKKALEEVNLKTITSEGYSFQIEMKYRVYKAGLAIKEIPIIFPDRTKGKSKMSKKIILEAMMKTWQIRKQ